MFCNKCGKEIPNDAVFCPVCGNPVNLSGRAAQGQPQSSSSTEVTRKFPYIKRRSIALCIFFSIITCGIYGLYWYYSIANDINTVSVTEDTSGGMVVLFSIITCGIYSIYWAYQCGAKVDRARGLDESNNNIVYLLLALFGFSIIAWCLIQNEINQHASY